ncbi:MAG: hypothetical protein ABSC47_12820 [Terracidiphilus sp.]|jgi:hypothetical protein
MKGIIRIVALTMLFVGAYAASTQQLPTPPTPKAPDAPVISDAMKAKFFKAQAQSIQAKANFDQAQKALQDSTTAFQGVISELTKVCGDSFTPQLDQSGDPVCTAKPEPPKQEPAKK